MSYGTLLTLMLVQGLLGAFDTIYYHEYRFLLPAHAAQTGPELRLHACRDFIYGVLYLTLPFFLYQGWLAAVLAVFLLSEIVVTLLDFAVEDDVRSLFGGVAKGERSMHTIIAIIYGAVLAGLLPFLAAWWRLPTELVTHQDASPWQRVVFPCMAIGVLLSGLRDWGAQAGWRGRLFR